MDKINVVVGIESARERFTKFYAQSKYLAEEELLEKVNKQALTLETKNFFIRFIPKNLDLLRGMHCDWAYGFDPDSTRYLEFRTADKLKELKPLVENVEELIRKIAKIEKGGW